jgi:hypothetical protein
MRETSIVAATAVITALITIWSMHALGTGMPGKPTADATSYSVMQMMRDAKGLPDQSYDTH